MLRHKGRYDYDLTVPYVAVIGLVLILVGIVWMSFARAQEIQYGKGLICDTKEQIASFLQKSDEGMPNDQALAAVNFAAGNGTACAAVQVAYYEGSEAAQFTGKETTFSIIEILVVGAHTGAGYSPVSPPARQFIYKAVTKHRSA